MNLTDLFPRDPSEADEEYQDRLDALAPIAAKAETIAEALCPRALGLPDSERGLRTYQALERVASALHVLKHKLEHATWLKRLLSDWRAPGGTEKISAVLKEAAAAVRALAEDGAFTFLFADDGLEPTRGMGAYTGQVGRLGFAEMKRVAPSAVSREEAARMADGLERLARALACSPARLAEEVADCQRADLRPAKREEFKEAWMAIRDAFITDAVTAADPGEGTKRRGRPSLPLRPRYLAFVRAVAALHALDLPIGDKALIEWFAPSLEDMERVPRLRLIYSEPSGRR